MSGLRCWPGCLAEFVEGEPNAGRRVFVDRSCLPAEHPDPTRGPAWIVTLLQPVRVAMTANGHVEGQTVLPGPDSECIAFDRDLRPILPPPASDTTETDDTAPCEVEHGIAHA